MNQLEQLKNFTTIVADTGDFQSIKSFTPRDATTNPSLILKAVQKSEYHPLLKSIVKENIHLSTSDIIDRLLVKFGEKILEIIPGRVSTETDARLSFDIQGSLEKGRKLVDLYENAGIGRERILIKIASTWEGIKAAEELEKDGIHCNLTLLFSLPQAIACAEAKVQLISPFVGRIYDWYKKSSGKEYLDDDPGVQSVVKIYNYLHKFGYATEVMGASFRSTSQIIGLAGCNLLTISPDLLQELASCDDPVTRRLSIEDAKRSNAEKIDISQNSFRTMLNDDAMATEKLSEGIRQFSADTIKLEKIIDDLR